MTQPPAPVPDDKDWTWVLERPCPDCGYAAPAVRREDFPTLTQEYVSVLAAGLTRSDATIRPSEDVWSPLEYGCHVRDVCTIFDERLHSMIVEDNPLFPNWNQDATALEQRYWTQDPSTVAAELTAAGAAMADRLARVSDDGWERPGRRSNGSEFTVDSLARYFLHDLAHHAWDVSGGR